MILVFDGNHPNSDFKMKKLISDTRLVLDQIIGTIGNHLRLNQCKMIRILMIDRKFKKTHYKTLLVRANSPNLIILINILEKHFNVSAAQAKKFMNQIKNQLHVNPPGEVILSKLFDRIFIFTFQSGDINSRFGQHGVSTASAGNDSISHLVDSKSNRNNIG